MTIYQKCLFPAIAHKADYRLTTNLRRSLSAVLRKLPRQRTVRVRRRHRDAGSGGGATQHTLAASSFLIHVFCLGIKDVMFKSFESEEFEDYMDVMESGSPIIAVEPAYARKLLRDLAAWSKSIGFAPYREFAAVEPAIR